MYVLPFFLVFGAFSIYPWLDTAWVSLHEVRLSTYDQQTWVGLDNYRDIFTNPFFWNAFRNTVTIGVISTVPQLCMALGIAHLLNYRLRGRTFFRVAILMPYATSLAAATVIFLELFDTKLGLVNWFLHVVHLPAVDWQGSKWPAQIAVSTIVTWRWTGYNTLIYLAGMQSIDSTLYEAAAVDGAGRWRQFLHVTLPGLRPTILFTIVVSTIGATQLFGEPLLYHNGKADGGTAGPVPDAGRPDVPAGLGQRPARPGLGHGLDHVRDHRDRGRGQPALRPLPHPGSTAMTPPDRRRRRRSARAARADAAPGSSATAAGSPTCWSRWSPWCPSSRCTTRS